MTAMEYLRELYEHQRWADAEHWRAIQHHQPAREDPGIIARLHHIHLVQHAFCSIVGHEAVTATSPEDFPTLAALRNYAREAHDRAMALLQTMTAARLATLLVIPWFKDPPIELTVEQALLQAAMHSHYHRGQNATRLRELGGDPPLTDLIVWYWKGRPAPRWD
jgi:uncharacterized damage-inducible protein DinB